MEHVELETIGTLVRYGVPVKTAASHLGLPYTAVRRELKRVYGVAHLPRITPRESWKRMLSAWLCYGPASSTNQAMMALEQILGIRPHFWRAYTRIRQTHIAELDAPLPGFHILGRTLDRSRSLIRAYNRYLRRDRARFPLDTEELRESVRVFLARTLMDYLRPFLVNPHLADEFAGWLSELSWDTLASAKLSGNSAHPYVDLVIMRFGLAPGETPHSIEETGAIFGLTRERTRRIFDQVVYPILRHDAHWPRWAQQTWQAEPRDIFFWT